MARPDALDPIAPSPTRSPSPIRTSSPLRSRRATRLGASVAVAAVLLAGVSACGGSSKQSTPLPVTGTTTAASGGSGGTTATTGRTVTSGGGSTPTTDAPATTVAPASSGGGGSFCKVADSGLAKTLKATEALGTSPADLRAEVSKFEQIAPALLASVPSSIRPQMADLLNYDKEIFTVLAKAGYNFAKISPADLQSIESGATKVASDSTAIEAYVEKACGVSLTSPTTA